MPGGKGNIVPGDNPKPFKKGQSGNPKGRQKKIYTILKEKGYSSQDVKTAFGELIFYTLPELREVHKDDSKPVIIRIVANQLFQALKNSDWNKIKDILEHTIGRPTQSHELSGKDGEPIKIESTIKIIPPKTRKKK